MFTAKRTANDGEISVEIPVINGYGAINYFCICSEEKALNNPSLINGQLVLESGTNKIFLDCSKSRKKLFKGLTPSVTYYFYVYASNTVSVSPISDVKSVMAAG